MTRPKLIQKFQMTVPAVHYNEDSVVQTKIVLIMKIALVFLCRVGPVGKGLEEIITVVGKLFRANMFFVFVFFVFS